MSVTRRKPSNDAKSKRTASNFSDFPTAERVFHYFEKISKIPRASGNTAPIADYLSAFAKENGLYCYRDEVNNVLIRKPATAGYENRPAVIIQGHTDMVKQCIEDLDYDFDSEGVRLIREGDLLRADGTTLGADDGIAIAYMLAILSSDELSHPTVEALFTSDEEIGLIGAQGFDCGRLEGRTMINIDSDREGIFTVGCAGGERIDISLPLVRDIEGGSFFKLEIGGLRGGHSGTEINAGRENAIKILAEALLELPALRICKIYGGSADNAIPRSASAIFSTDIAHSGELFRAVSLVSEKYKICEPDIHFELSTVGSATLPFTEESSNKIVRLISEEPCGVVDMSADIEGLVETSLNLGILATEESALSLTVSVRSSKNERREALVKKVLNIAKKFGAKCNVHGSYPAWEYKKDSKLREVMCRVHERMYGKRAEVMAIHAGLECGIFSGKLPELDCVSIGPDSFDIHTTEERLSLSSAARVWIFLLEVLKKL